MQDFLELHLEFLFIYSPKWLFAYPGGILFLLGLFFTIIIYIHPLHIGKVQFEVTTMLYSALAMLIGMQCIQFSVFSTIYAERIGQIPQTKKSIHKIVEKLNFCGYKVAIIIMIISMMGIIGTLIAWGKMNFGAITTTWICKTSILFGSLFAVGIEMFLFTLLAKILQIGKRND